MAKVKLTDTKVRSLKATGATYDIWDENHPGLGIRVSATGRKTWIFYARLPGRKSPSRNVLGPVGSGMAGSDPVGLWAARDKAKMWRDAIRAGDDPRQAEVRERRRKAEARANTLGSVAADYFVHIRTREKPMARPNEVENALRNGFIDILDTDSRPLNERPVSAITWSDVKHACTAKRLEKHKGTEEGKPAAARTLFRLLRAFFKWAVEEGVYGLQESPFKGRNPRSVVGTAEARQRWLRDWEIRIFWLASERLGYPFRDVFRLCLLTGQRRSEVASVEKQDLSLPKGDWTVPATKMKMKDPHFVPLSRQAIEIFASAPRYNEGDFVFSGTNGREPVSGFSKAMTRLRAEMDVIYSEEAGDPDAKIEHFRLHDLRRTCRTKISRYTTQEIAELIIGHKRKGLIGIYALYEFAEERRDVLTRWALEIDRIVNGAPVASRLINHAIFEKSGSLFRFRKRDAAKV